MNKGTSKNLANKTLEQVKQEVLEMVDSAVNYREIAKIPFKIDGVIRRFSISQISKWKKERDKGVEEDGGVSASKAFQIFEEGKGPVQAVVQLNLLPEDAEAYYKKWLEMKEQDLSPPSIPRRLKEMEDKLDDPPSLLGSYIQEVMGDEEGEYPDAEDVWEFMLSIRYVMDIFNKVRQLPILGMYENFTCECGSKHNLAVKIKCTKCGEETWLGYWPEEN